MTQDDVIRLADKCGLIGYFELDGDSVGILGLEAFAKLVAEHERKECALIADKANKYNRHISRETAEAIRARGQA
jgi:hypothetical protein